LYQEVPVTTFGRVRYTYLTIPNEEI